MQWFNDNLTGYLFSSILMITNYKLYCQFEAILSISHTISYNEGHARVIINYAPYIELGLNSNNVCRYHDANILSLGFL